MIIIAGHLRMDPACRRDYVDGCRPVVEQARRTSGCRDFQVSEDALEPDRVNVYECWDDPGALEVFRGSGTADEQSTVITAADVMQYDVAGQSRLT